MNPPPIPPNTLILEPMPDAPNPISIFETLLKRPGRILHELQHQRAPALRIWLLLLALVGMALYGLIIGTLSGGSQLLIAPAKMALGILLAMLICLPSLYIFTCLDGIETRFRTVSGMLFAAVCLSALLLIGFAPVGWIFSQSTDSIPLTGTLHLIFWGAAIAFGLRLLNAARKSLGRGGRTHSRIWNVIFILVCLQMTSTLRPIIGHADTFLPREKRFFVSHWFTSIFGEKQSAD